MLHILNNRAYMRVDLPLKFMDEYWDMPASKRKVLGVSVSGLLPAQGADGAKKWLIEQGWSSAFAEWVIPVIERQRGDFEIEAIPSVPDLGRELANYEAWKKRKKKNFVIAWISLACHIGCLVFTFVYAYFWKETTPQMVAGIDKESDEASRQAATTLVNTVLGLHIAAIVLLCLFMAYSLLAKGRSPWFSLCGIVVFVLLFLPDAADRMSSIISTAFWFISATLVVVYLCLTDVNKQVAPVATADHENLVRLAKKARETLAREAL